MSKTYDASKAKVSINGKEITGFTEPITVEFKETDEDRRFLDEFKKAVAEGLQVHCGEPTPPSEVKRLVRDVVRKQFEDAGQSSDVECKRLWDTFGWYERFLWRLYRIWPFSWFAENERKLVAKQNRINNLQNELDHLRGRDENSYVLPIEYRNAIHPDPKRSLIVTARLVGAIQSVHVSGEVTV